MAATKTRPSDRAPVRRRDVTVAAACGVFVALMVGAAYASVPLYDWFCRSTGFGGRTMVATAAPGQVLDRKVTVRFDANMAPGLAWRFVPDRTSVDVRLGEVMTVSYTVVNETARPTTGLASYNVSPPQAGAYFSKINCFCFEEQTLKPGEKREMTVVFFVDPNLAKDVDEADFHTITLSYTMHPVREPARPVAQGERATAGGKS